MIGSIPVVGSVSQGFGNSIPDVPNAEMKDPKEATKHFVAMLYSYMFKTMRESASDEENGLFSGAHANMMMGFLDQEIGKQMAFREGSGLADQVYEQLTGQKADPKPDQRSLKTDADSLEDVKTDGTKESNDILKQLYKVNHA